MERRDSARPLLLGGALFVGGLLLGGLAAAALGVGTGPSGADASTSASTTEAGGAAGGADPSGGADDDAAAGGAAAQSPSEACAAAGEAGQQALDAIDAAAGAVADLDAVRLDQIVDDLRPLRLQLPDDVAACRAAVQGPSSARRRRAPDRPDHPEGGTVPAPTLAPVAHLLDVLLGRASPTGGEAEALAACLSSPLWVAGVLDSAPYPDVEALLEQADAAARALPPEAVLAALATHPRLGDEVPGEGPHECMCRLEQSSLPQDPGSRERLQEAVSAYEARFGHHYLVRAAGLGEEEVLADLGERLGNDAAAELEVSADQLRQVALLRLQAVLSGVVATPAEPQPS